MKHLLKLLLLVLISYSAAYGQSCTTAVCNAPVNFTPAQLLAAMPNSSAPATVVVNLPTTTTTWTSPFAYTVPPNVTNLTIQGQTTVNCTGAPGSSGYVCTATDNTVIIDAYNSGASTITLSLGAANTFFRLTGVTLKGGNIGTTTKSPANTIGGASQNFRMDHNHFRTNDYSHQPNAEWHVNGRLQGVIDHNLVELGTANGLTNGFGIETMIGDNIGNGDGGWAQPTNLGAASFVFIESNFFNGAVTNDCGNAARFVERYNTIINASNLSGTIQSHGIGQGNSTDRSRGCRALEVYHNYVASATGVTNYALIGFAGGVYVAWGNLVSGSSHMTASGYIRKDTTSHPQQPVPTAFGMCGNVTGGPTAWDGNFDSTGWPCLGQQGRGQDLSPMNGADFPNVGLQSGCIPSSPASSSCNGWTQSLLEPSYQFMNSNPGHSNDWSNSLGNNTATNRDIYFDCGPANPACTGGFTGAKGTGFGALSGPQPPGGVARPATCTPGPGGTFGQSPTGSYGAAWWATDANGGNGELYVCTSTNTWTPVYQPFQYPHPLTGGGPQTINAADCSQSALNTAWGQMNNSTVTIVLPSCPAGGTGTWTGQLSLTVPSTVTNLTIQGQTAVNCTGPPGTSTYICTATDNTTIIDGSTTSTPILNITTGANSTFFRITGLTVEPLNSSIHAKNGGTYAFSGSTHNFRWDHSNITAFGVDNVTVGINGKIEGVFDHNILSVPAGEIVDVNNDPLDTVGNGDGGWMAATQWGGQHAMFFESNYIPGDTYNCGSAGRLVQRYNTIVKHHGSMNGAVHSTKDNGGAVRGCRSEEVYHNYISGATIDEDVVQGEGSSMVVWGNIEGNFTSTWFYAGGLYRNTKGQSEPAGKLPPNGWGMCGTNINYPGTPGTDSAWDANSNTATGYPCLDGLGRGQQLDGMNGANFPNRANTTNGCTPGGGCSAWPHQMLEPMYFFMNTLPNGMSGEILTQDQTTVKGRDIIFDCNQYNPACPTGFTGAAGTGFGPLSSRPSACTAGPGGTFGQSPTGSYGVAYFATDANGGNGELYVCTTTGNPGIWTPIYQPFTYPHPLTNPGPCVVSGVTVSPNSASVNVNGTINFSAVVNFTGTCTGTVTWSATGGGSISPSGVYTAPGVATSNVVITATSTDNPNFKGTASVTVTSGGACSVTSVSVSPSSITLNVNAQQTFTPTVTFTGSCAGTVTWSVSGGGSITSGGVYTAPGTATTGIVVTATSTDNSSISGTANVTVNAPSGITVNSAASNTTSNSAFTTVTISISSGHTAVINCGQGANNTSTAAITDSSGSNTWVQSASGYSRSTLTLESGMWYSLLSASITSVTCTWSNPTITTSTIRATVFDISGTATSLIEDSSVNSNSASTTSTYVSGNLTTTNSNDILLFGVNAASPETFSAGAGYTLPAGGQDTNSKIAMQYKVVSSTQSSTTTSITGSVSSTGNTTVFLALKGVQSAVPCSLNTAIGPFTLCNQWYTNFTSGTSFPISVSPFAGNGVEVFFAYCTTNCATVPSQTVTSISDNINSPETCFTQAPHSPYTFFNSGVPDSEKIYTWYCPSIPSGVTSLIINTNSSVLDAGFNVIELESGVIATSNFFENVDSVGSSGNVAGTTASISTSGTTSSPIDLITALIANCGADTPATVGAGYTGITVNPPQPNGGDPGWVTEAMAVSSTGIQTATTTWSASSVSAGCGLGTTGRTWWGAIVPLRSNQQPTATIAPTSILFPNTDINTTSSGVTVTLTNTGNLPVQVTQAQTFSTNFTLVPNSGTCFSMFGSNTSFTLPVGQNCNFIITFSPTATTTYNSTFQVTSNTVGSPLAVSLSGQGIGPAITMLSPQGDASYTYGIVAIGSTSFSPSSCGTPSNCLEISNTGTGTLNISLSITGTNISNFAITTNTCGTTLAAGASCTATVSFTPNSVSSFSAFLTETDTVNSLTGNLTLTGMGFNPVVSPVAPAPWLIIQ